jgi:vacuolar-type H+-ATPase subunit I/STV1
MAKEKKVRTRDTPKYTSSSDEDSYDDVDYSNLFKGLDRSKVDKINELIDALNKKDMLLEKQEDILYEVHDKLVNVEKTLAFEVKKSEIISSEFSSCHESISSLKSLNADLNARMDKLNITSSSVEHVSICNRCKDFDIDVYNDHTSTICKLNDEVANLNSQHKICKNECKINLPGMPTPLHVLGILSTPNQIGVKNQLVYHVSRSILSPDSFSISEAREI